MALILYHSKCTEYLTMLNDVLRPKLANVIFLIDALSTLISFNCFPTSFLSWVILSHFYLVPALPMSSECLHCVA